MVSRLVPRSEAVEERDKNLHPALRAREHDASTKLRDVLKLRGPVRIERAVAVEAERGFKPDAKIVGHHLCEVSLQLVINARNFVAEGVALEAEVEPPRSFGVKTVPPRSNRDSARGEL
jgi:hypothetical protein